MKVGARREVYTLLGSPEGLHTGDPVVTPPFCGIQPGIAWLHTAKTDCMQLYGVKVMYRDSDTGHMDFTFTMKDDVQHYVMQRLLRT